MALPVPIWGLSALAGVLLLALSAALLVLDRRQLAIRAFVALLVFRAAGAFTRALLLASDSFAVERAASLAFPVMVALSSAGGLYFVLAYPRRSAWLARPGAVWILVAAPVVAITAVVVFWPDLYATFVPTTPGGARIAATGPVFGLVTLGFVAAGLFALVFAWEYARAPRFPGRSALLLVALAFALEPAFTATSFVLADVAGTLRLLPGAGGRMQAIVFEAGMLPILALVLVLLRARGRDEVTRREVPVALSALGVSALTAIVLFAMAPTLELPFTDPARGYATGALRLMFPVLVAYALVQHRLFDLDLKIKWTIRRGTLAAVFIAAFVVAAQVAQNVFSASYGVWIGGVAAGLLLFAVAPLQRMAEKVANVAMPGVHDTPEWRAGRREDSFRFAVRMALADGVVTRDEDRGLASLASDLGLDPRRAFELREEIEREGEGAARA